MEIHSRTWTGEKPIKYDICEKKFNVKAPTANNTLRYNACHTHTHTHTHTQTGWKRQHQQILKFLKAFKVHQQPDSKYSLKVFQGNLKPKTDTFNLLSKSHKQMKLLNN